MSEMEEALQPESRRSHTIRRLPGRLDRSEHWPVYDRALNALEASKIPYAVGGAFALGVYTGFFRDTKDLDLYILPTDQHRAAEALLSSGPTDLFDRDPYDRNWIFRAVSNDNDIVVDLIWRFANYVADVDEGWLSLGQEIKLGDHVTRAIPAEELLWAKLYIIQRNRCDWTDLLNLLYAQASEIDWPRLLMRIAGDRGLLAALLSVFAWLCPGRAADVPSWVWSALGIRPSFNPDDVEVHLSRVTYLDSRPWFFASMS